MKRALVLLLCASVLGCAEDTSRQQALQGLIGHPESDAIRLLGVPSRTFETNGRTFLAWDGQRLDYAAVGPGFGPWGPWGWGYYAPATVPVMRGCQTTLEVGGGKVLGWALHGADC